MRLFELISKRLLRIQLIMHLNTLIETDYKILTENGLYWSTQDWQFASMQRGIDPNNPKPEMIYRINEFCKISD